MAWIDYKKAFDSVPHSWILETMRLYHTDATLYNFCQHTMNKWSTVIKTRTTIGDTTTRRFSINKGIFQGDSLSPLLFCISLIPLTHLLNYEGKGYQLQEEKPAISHLLYMDDLKLYAKNEKELRDLLYVVKSFSDDIKMQFGLDKCAKVILKRGKIEYTENIKVSEDVEIKGLEQGEAYKYLGILENGQLDNNNMKEKIRKEYIRRTRLLLNSELSGRNKFRAIGSLAVPVVEYSLGIIDWTLEEIRSLDRKTRKLLTLHGLLHPRADVDRLYVPRKSGGRGLRQLELAYKTATIGLGSYVELKGGAIVEHIRNEDQKKAPSKSLIKNRDKLITQRETNIEKIDLNEDRTMSEKVKKQKKEFKDKYLVNLKNTWENKELHGQYPKKIAVSHIDIDLTFQWLQRGKTKGETEALITAAQDQALRTKYYEKNILKMNTDGKCRVCKDKYETVDHIVSACSELAKHEYIQRHDKLCTYLHWKICDQLNIPTEETQWYKHKPESVVRNDRYTVLYNEQVHTDRMISANKPDIIIKDKQNKQCQLIDVAIPADHNLIQKEAEKMLKYRDLSIEISRMWDMRTEIVPIIIGALGAIPKTLNKNISKVPGQIKTQELQEATLYSTAHILRRTLG